MTMRYSIGGDDLARLIVAAGARMDADEIGEIVHGVKPIAEPTDTTGRPDEPMFDEYSQTFPSLKPE